MAGMTQQYDVAYQGARGGEAKYGVVPIEKTHL